MIIKIHQKYCELPIAATGAAASATNTTQITVSMQLSILNFFFSPIRQAPFSLGTTPVNMKKHNAHFLFLMFFLFYILFYKEVVPHSLFSCKCAAPLPLEKYVSGCYGCILACRYKV